MMSVFYFGRIAWHAGLSGARNPGGRHGRSGSDWLWPGGGHVSTVTGGHMSVSLCHHAVVDEMLCVVVCLYDGVFV